MSLAEDLLGHARQLAELNPASIPAQVDLRRSISAAYYSVFHLLSEMAADQVGSALPVDIRAKTQRALDHKRMYNVAGLFAKAGRDRFDEKAVILPDPISTRLANVADGFRTLQEQRHNADYAPLRTFNRIMAIELVETAEVVFADWDSEKATSNAQVFLTALVLWEIWRK